MGCGQWSFTTGNGLPVDATPLMVTSVTPMNGSTGVSQNGIIVLTFSKSLNTSTVNQDTLQISNGSSNQTSPFFISADNRTITISSPLPPNTTVTVTANSGIQDLYGNSIVSFQSQFTTVANVPGNAPLVISMRPGIGATGASPISKIKLFTKDNPLNPDTVPDSLRITQNGVQVSGVIKLMDMDTTIEFTPDESFVDGALVAVTLNNSVQDIYGNMLQPFSGQFTVQGSPASAAPQLLAANPYNGASNVPLNVLPQFAFDQQLDSATINPTSVSLYDTCTNQPVPGEVALVSGCGVVGGNNVIQFQPQGPLTATCNGSIRTYRFQINNFGGVATGANGLAIPGVTYFFTAGTASDTANLSVTSVVPANNSTSVGINDVVLAIFNKPVNPISVTDSTIRIIDGSQVVVPSSITFNSTGTVVTITPLAPLPENTQFAFAINGVADFDGNLVAPFASQFTTSTGPDIAKPTIISATPLSGTSVSKNIAGLTVQFNKSMDPLSINGGTFYLYDSTANVNIPGAITSSTDLTTYTFSPSYANNETGGMTAGNSLFLKIDGAQDLAGNRSDPATYFYTVSSGQTATEPAIFNFDPVNAVVGTHVVISGSNFDSIPTNDAVRFNGIVATVISATKTQLIVIVPTGATTGPITISTPAGTATTASQFIVGTRDIVAPTTTIISPVPNMILSGDYFTITGAVSDVGYGAALVELSLDNGASWQNVWYPWYGSNSWSYNWTLPTNGNFTLKARGTDVSGNVGAASSVTVTVDNGEFTAPTINPIPAVVPATTVAIVGSKLPRAVQMKVSCGAAIVDSLTITSATTWTATLSGLAQGQNTVTAFGIDSTGTASPTGAMTFTVDTIPPAPATSFSAATVPTGVRLDWTNSSSSDMREYRLYWDNGSGVISYTSPITVIPYPINSFTMGVQHEGTYHFGLRAVDKAGNEEKNTDLIASATVNGYSVSLSVTGDVHQRGQDVPITGMVIASDSTPLVNIPVSIDVESRGYIRTFTVYTKATGAFNYTFQPMATEAGSYSVSARTTYQGLDKSSSVSFSITGMLLGPAVVTIDMSMNSTRTVNINLTNIGSTGMTNLQYALVDNDLSDPVKGFIDPSSLPTSLAAGASVIVPVLIIADPGTPPAVAAVFTLNVTSSEGSNEFASITAQSHDAVSLPVVNPDPIMVGVRIGTPVTKNITITNQGYAPMQDSTLTVHDTILYGWVSIPNGTFGQFSPQDAKSCQVVVNPPEGTTLGTYVVQLDLNYNGITKPVYMTVEVTTATVGQVSFKVHDDTGSVVSGATVNLISKAFYVNVTPSGQQEYNNVIKGTTDQQGYILFNDVPAGDYRYVVSADRHDQQDGTLTVEPGSTIQAIGIIMVTNLVNVDFSVVPTTIQDQYNVNLNITYVTDLIKPTLFVTPYRVDLSFFPEETSQGGFTIQNTSNNAPVRNLVLDSSALDVTDSELKIVFDDGTATGTQTISLGDLAPGQSIQVSYKAIIYGTNPKLNNRNLGNISATAEYTYSIDGQANVSTTTTPIPVLYWKPQDFSLPGITYVNDETGGRSCNLQFQGNTYRMSVKTNRNMGVTLDTLKAVNQVNGGPDAASIISANIALWNGGFTPTTLQSKGDVATFDIDDLTSGLTARCSSDRSNFLGKPNFIGFGASWADRNPASDFYLIPISIITKSDVGVIIGDSTPSSGGGGWVGGTVPTFNDHGTVKLEIDQKVSLEREAFNSTLSVTPSVTPLENFRANISIKDSNGNDASGLFFVVVTQQTGIASIGGSSVSGPVGITWQLIPSSSAGGTTADGQIYSVSAAFNYNFSGSSYSFTTQAETVTVKPMPKLTLSYKLPYITMAGKPVKVKVVVTNNGYGPAHNLVISSAQPKIIENLSNLPISFTLLGSSATPGDSTLQNGVLNINFGDIPSGGTVEGYWLLSTSKDGYFVNFTSTLTHQDYMGISLDPLIQATNTQLIPAIGGEIFMPQKSTTQGMKVELYQGGLLVGQDTVNSYGNYLISDLTAGGYQWLLKDSSGSVIDNGSQDITVVDGQPTARIDFGVPPRIEVVSFEPTLPSAKNLVVVTHGWYSNIVNALANKNDLYKPWLTDMLKMICLQIKNKLGYSDDVEITDSGCAFANWEVRSYIWIDDAYTLTPNDAYDNAEEHGKNLAASIVNNNYNYVHLIGHSAGAKLIDTAANIVKANSPGTKVLLTFLDAYDPNNGNSNYGASADNSEHYVDKRTIGTSTNYNIPNAFNFDISLLDPNPIDNVNPVAQHGWPHDFYNESYTNDYDFGFVLSKESQTPSVDNWSYPEKYKKGYCLPLSIGYSQCGIDGWISGAISIVDTVITDICSNCASSIYDAANLILEAKSVTGTIDEVINSGTDKLLVLTSGSPAWVQYGLNLPREMNTLKFGYKFTSNAQGLLSVFLDNKLVYKGDERLWSNTGNASGSISLGQVNPGQHTLTFRLDPFTATQSSVQVSNIQFTNVVATDDSLSTDTTKPTSTITFPASGGIVTGNNLQITGSADDGAGSGVKVVEVSVDGGSTWNLANGTTNWQYSWNLTAAGSYLVISRATDNAGNVEIPGSGVNFMFTLTDTIPPSGSIIIQNTDNVTNATTIALVLSANDMSGVTQMCISNTESCTNWQRYATSLSWQLDSGDGLKTVHVWFKDGAGNSNLLPYTVSITLDTTSPVLSLSTLPDGAYTNNNTLNISGNVTDNMAVKSFTINGTPVPLGADGSFSSPLPLTAGMNNVTAIAIDQAGNTTTDSRSITLDQSAPVLSVSSPADNSKTAKAALTIDGTVDKSATISVKLNSQTPAVALVTGTTFSSDLTLVSGLNTIVVTATDQAGNTATAKRTVVYDDQSPSLAITDPTQDISTNQQSITLKGTVSDALTAVTVTITKDGEVYTPTLTNGAFEQIISFTTEKTYQIIVKAVNEVGTEAIVTRNIIYDITKPALDITVITPTRFNTQTISGIKEDGSQIVVDCLTATVGGISYPTPTTWSVTLTSLTEGLNQISATSQDAAGNETIVIKNILFDATAPIDGSITVLPGNSQVALTWKDFSDTGSGIDSYRLVYDSLQSPASCDMGQVIFEGQATSFTHTSLLNGIAYNYRLCAIDKAGNISLGVTSTATPIAPDTTPPDGSVTINQGDSYTRSNQIILSLAATDPSGVTQMCVSSTGTCNNWQSFAPSLAWPLSSDDGLKTVNAWFKDGVGNSNALPYTASITLDITAPVLSLSSLPDGAYTNNATLNTSGTVTDTFGVKGLTINGAGVPINPDHSFSHALALLTGANAVKTVATDLAGNQTTDSRLIIYDPNAPVLTVTGPMDNSLTNKSFVNVTGTIDKIATVQVKVNSGQSGLASITSNNFNYAANLFEGTNTIEIIATDLASNTAQAKRTIIYDDQKPSVSITNPAQDITTSQNSITLTGTVSDALTAVTVTITADGKTFTPAVVNGTFGQVITFTNANSYAIIVTATDQAGNQASVQRNVIYAPQKWNDITTQTAVTKSGTLSDLVNNVYFTNISVKNSSTASLAGPLRMVIVNPSIPLNITAPVGLKPDGYTTAGEPYFTIVPQSGALAAGASISNLRVNFAMQRVTLTYSVRIEQLK